MPSRSSWDSVRNGATSIQRPYSRYQDPHTQYRGVSHKRYHKRSGRWQAHLWHQSRQVHLGIFDREVQAACAHDVAAIRFKQQDARTNFPLSLYQDTFVHWNTMTEEELVQCLRQLGSAKSSRYVGVNKNENSGKWEARYPLSKEGHGGGSKYVNLGLHNLEVEAAEAYDREAIRRRGRLAVTNFAITHYPGLLAAAEATGLSSNESPAGSNEPSKTRGPDVAEETVDWIPANIF